MSVFLRADLAPMLAATLAAVVCGLLGNYLVLRRQSLMGDAISHAVLPGLVIGFILSQSVSPGPMFLGAAGAGLVTVLMAELIRRLGRVEPGAALGVMFSVMFALGVLLIEQANIEGVDLDAGCVLHGQIEHVTWWDGPEEASQLTDPRVWRSMPQQVKTLLIVAFLTVGLILAFYKELRIASFDAQLARAQGLRPGLVDAGLLILTAVATVAAFEVVGSVLVIALLVCPAVIGRLLTDRLGPQLLISVIAAAFAGIVGYLAAGFAMRPLGIDAVNAAGMIAVVLGVMIALTALFAPTYGVIPRRLRRSRIAGASEPGEGSPPTPGQGT